MFHTLKYQIFNLFGTFCSIYLGAMTGIIYNKVTNFDSFEKILFSIIIPGAGLCLFLIPTFSLGALKEHYTLHDMSNKKRSRMYFKDSLRIIWENKFSTIIGLLVLFLYPPLLFSHIDKIEKTYPPIYIKNCLHASVINGTTLVVFKDKKIPKTNSVVLMRETIGTNHNQIVSDAPTMTDSSLVWKITPHFETEHNVTYKLLCFTDNRKVFHVSNNIIEDTQAPLQSGLNFDIINKNNLRIEINEISDLSDFKSTLIIKAINNVKLDTTLIIPPNNTIASVPVNMKDSILITLKSIDVYGNSSVIDTSFNYVPSK